MGGYSVGMRGNVRQAVPFFHVTNMERALRFYCDGLGAVRTKAGATVYGG